MLEEDLEKHLSTSASSLNYYHQEEDEEKPPLELSTSFSKKQPRKQSSSTSTASAAGASSTKNNKNGGVNAIQRSRRGSAASTAYGSSNGDSSSRGSSTVSRRSADHGGDAFLPTSFHSSLRSNHMMQTNPNHPGATMKNRFKVHMRQSIPLHASTHHRNNNLNHCDSENEEMLRVTTKTKGHLRMNNGHGHKNKKDDYSDEEYSDEENHNDERHSLLPSSNDTYNSSSETSGENDPVLIWNHLWMDFWDLLLSILPIHSGPRQSRKMSVKQRKSVRKWKKILLALFLLFLSFWAVIHVTSPGTSNTRSKQKNQKSNVKAMVIHDKEKVNPDDDDVSDLFPSQSKLQAVNPKPDKQSSNSIVGNKAIDDDFHGQEDAMMKQFHKKQGQRQRPPSADEEEIFSTNTSTNDKQTTNKVLSSSYTENRVNNNGAASIKVHYVVTIDSCYPKEENMLTPSVPLNDAQFHDAAVVLKQSIHDNSIRNGGTSKSKYDYQMVALMHESVIECEMYMKTTSSTLSLPGGNRKELLESLGYIVHVVSNPIEIKEISQKTSADLYLYMMINKDEFREFITLKAFSFDHVPLVVLVDFTTMLLKPPDDVFGLILNPSSNKQQFMNNNNGMVVKQTAFPNGSTKQITDLPSNIDVLYTKDYSSVAPKQWVAGISLSFFVFKPSLDIYSELLQVLRSGQYTDAHGWGSLGYKSRKVKGLLTYFFQERKFQQSIEVHRCTYNNRAENPTINLHGRQMCRDVLEKDLPMEKCTDCRQTSLNEIVVANTATCMAPWRCNYPRAFNMTIPTDVDGNNENKNTDNAFKKGYSDMKKLCQSYNKRWYEYRQEYESQHSDLFTTKNPGGGFRMEHFQGYCAREAIYLPMRVVEENQK